jgi:hypothetical protein
MKFGVSKKRQIRPLAEWIVCIEALRKIDSLFCSSRTVRRHIGDQLEVRFPRMLSKAGIPF